jgi:AP-3 complex subunit sigma
VYVLRMSFFCIVFVETLDKVFQHVCELDILFHFTKVFFSAIVLLRGVDEILCFLQVHHILDEIVMGGLVLETNIDRIVHALNDISHLVKRSSPFSLSPKKGEHSTTHSAGSNMMMGNM